MTPKVHVLPTPDAIAAEGAVRIIETAARAIAALGRFSLVLSGGSTPKALYQQLTHLSKPFPWEKVHIYFGDERCVPPDHPESNYRMARQALLSAVPIPANQVYRMKGELEPHQAAAEYDGLLRGQFPQPKGADLTLLGMGDDGHTASLFPGTVALHETQSDCVANHVEKLNAWRLTMTAPFLNRSRAVLVLVAGAAKAQRLHEVLQGPSDPDRLPIQLIRPVSADLTFLVDKAAMEQNS